jgi:pyruvate/2-oxoglutarate dehydrogenase complex dihydrolipoamide acyltransferase (E2) component
MDTTASSFTLRKNAKRAAEAMIRKGAAPAVDYGIKPSDNGRFEIIWKIAKAAPTTDEVAIEIAEASANQPVAASPTEAASQRAPAATEPATTEAATQRASEVEVASQPAPAATEPAPALSEPAPKNEWPAGTRVMVRKRKSWREATIINRLVPDHWRAEYPGGGSGMFRKADIRAYDPKRDATPAKQSRCAKAAAPQKSSQSRYRIDPETIAAGGLPQRAPVVTSAANPHYQKHFDRLFGLAKAGDWDGVRNYDVKGSNSYSKMVARYRQDLLAVHAASEAAR